MRWKKLYIPSNSALGDRKNSRATRTRWVVLVARLIRLLYYLPMERMRLSEMIYTEEEMQELREENKKLKEELEEIKNDLGHRDSILSIMYDLLRSDLSDYEQLCMIDVVIDVEVWNEPQNKLREELLDRFWKRDF